MGSIEALDARFYPAYVDEHAKFDALVRRRLRPGDAVLDVGAGRGLRYPYDYRDRARTVGVDLDPSIRGNPNLAHAVIGDVASLPFRDATFDLAFSKYVFEHLEDPTAAFRELRRVLRPGAHLLLHTPNRWHYVAISARFTPHRFHVWFNGKRGCGPDDTFPTRYRANTRRRLEELAADAAFRIVSLEVIETKPDYLAFHPWAYRAGIAYERLVNRYGVLEDLRVQILADLRSI